MTAGLSIVLVFVLAIGAFAATGVSKRSLSAIFRNIQLKINGNIIATEEEPFIIDGKTYVPLRVVGQALGALVNWDSDANLVTIDGSGTSSEVEALKAQLQQTEAENARLKAQIEDLQGDSGTTPDPDTDPDTDTTKKSILDLNTNLLEDYDKLADIKIKDIRLTGNKDDITVNIDVNLDVYDNDWEELTDNKIKSWVADICLDIQDYYSDDTSIMGKIKDTDSKDTLIEFSKYRTQALKISYKDKDHRDGGGFEVGEVEDDWEGQRYSIAGIRFSLNSVSYDTKKDEINLILQATDAKTGDWEAADSDAAEAAIKGLCKDIADSFIEDATENPRTVNVKIYDKAQKSLDSFKYDVSDDALR